MRKTLIILTTYFICISTNAQKSRTLENLNVNEILSDTQFSDEKVEDLNLIWWIPTEFWAASSASDPSVSSDDQQALEEMIENYTIVAVVRGKVGLFGGVTFDDYESTRENLEVSYHNEKLGGSKLYRPIKEDGLSPDLVNFFDIIRPMLKNMMGSMGENFHIFAYQNEDREALFNPYSKDLVHFELEDISLELKFPIASLIERKYCPNDNELHKGTWDFCPFHGDKLQEQR